MEQDVNNKIELKDKLVNFYNSNKKNLYLYFCSYYNFSFFNFSKNK